MTPRVSALVTAVLLPRNKALYGVCELVELQFRVGNVRREIAERRAREKAEDRAAAAAKRKEVSMTGTTMSFVIFCP